MSVDVSALTARLHVLGEQWVDRMTDDFIQRASQRASRRTGGTVASMHATPAADEGSKITAEITVDEPSARYQDEGTGIYGPEGTRITPVNGKVLRFDWPAAGGIVFATSVAGSPGTHFWSLTVDEWPEIVGSV